MKILQINKLYFPTIGGIETIVKIIAENLNDDGKSVDVLACQPKGKRRIEKINGVMTYKAASLGKKFGMPISFDFFFLFFRLRGHYDKFILHFPFPLAALIAPFIPKKKLLIYFHSDIIRQKLGAFLFSPFIKFSLKHADKIFVSNSNLVTYSPLLRNYRDKCAVIPFGVDVSYNAGDREAAAALRSKYNNRTILLAVGRLVYYKGFEYAIEAMKSIDAQLLIIGTGPYKEKLDDLIIKNKVVDKVTILPPQADLKAFFLACDIFIFPSVEPSEAFGLVQLEAMAAGKPVINTILHTGVEEVSINGETGITIPPRNGRAISDAINNLLGNPVTRETYGAQAQLRYRRLYTEKIFIDRLKKVLKD
ncbi:MAG: glycosyltransferase [Bacillota bacterium]